MLYLKNGWKWVEGTVYIDKKTKIPAICHCGNEFMVAVSNIRENRVGCPDCYRYNRRYSWIYIEGYADKHGCIVSQFPGIPYRGKDTYIHMICSCEQEVVKTARQFLKSPKCKACSCKYGEDNFFGTEYGKSIVRVRMMDKYGVPHNMKVPEILLKSQETCMKNYGYKCILEEESVREKAAEAYLQKYGASFGCVESIREKMKETNMKNLGVEYPLQSKEVQKKIGDNNFAKYGNRVYIVSDTGKIHMTDLYGFPYAMQNAELFAKARRTAYAYKSYTFPSGRVVEVQGYEHMCLDYLLKRNTREDDIIVSDEECPVVTYEMDDNNCSHRYFMDMYIVSQDKAIEVKSVYTYFIEKEKNEAKWIAASKVCSSIDVYIFEKKDGLIARKTIVKGVVTDYLAGENKDLANLIPVNTIYELIEY